MLVKRVFKGVWIPSAVWLDQKITWMEKLVLAEISSLDDGSGCYASNAYLGNFFQLGKSRTSEIISSLSKKKYVRVKLQKNFYGGAMVTQRRVFVLLPSTGKPYPPTVFRQGGSENRNTPTGKPVVENILYNNKQDSFACAKVKSQEKAAVKEGKIIPPHELKKNMEKLMQKLSMSKKIADARENMRGGSRAMFDKARAEGAGK